MSCSQNNRISHIDYPRSCCQVPQSYYNCCQPVHQAQPQCFQHPIQKPSCQQIQNCQTYGCQTNFHQNQSCISCPIQSNLYPQVPISNNHETKSFNCTSSFNHAQDSHLQGKNIDNLTQTTPQPASRVNEEKHSPIQTQSQNPNDISIVEKRILELEKNRYKLEKELLKGELRRRDELRKYRKMFAQSNENKNQLQQAEIHENQVNQLRQSQQFINKEILLADFEQKNSRGNSFDGQAYNKFQQTPVGSNFRSQNEFSTANNAVNELSFLPQNLFNQNAVQNEQYLTDENHQNLEYQQNIDSRKLQQVYDQIERQQNYLMANNFPIQNQRVQQYSNSKKYQVEELPAFSSKQFMTVNQSLHDENIQPNQFIQRNLDQFKLPLSESVPDQMARSEILFDSQGRQVIVNFAYQNSQNNSNCKIPFQNQFCSQNEAQILQNLKKQREIYLKSQNLQNNEIQLSSGYSIKSSITDQEYGNDYQKIVTEPSKNIQPFSSQERGRVKRGSQSPQKNHNFNYKTTQFYNNQFAYQQPKFQNNNISNQDSMIADQSNINQQIFIKNQELENKNQFQNFQRFDQKYQMNIVENPRLNSGKNDENKIQFTHELPKIQHLNQNKMSFPYQNQSQNSSIYELKERTTPQISQQQFLEFNQNKNIFQSFDNIVTPSNGFIKEQDINSQNYTQMSKPVQSLSSSIMNNDNALKTNQQMFETGSQFQIFDKSKNQGYFLQNRHYLSQQPVDYNIFKSQSMHNHDHLLPQNQVASILNESQQNQSNFSLNNKSYLQDFDQRNELIQKNQKIFFENNETFNGSKQILPAFNYQSQNFDFINNIQNLQDSINQRESFTEKPDKTQKILNISHVNSIQIIPENNIFQNLEIQQKELSNNSDQKFSQKNKKLSAYDSAEQNRENESIILPKFKMKELRSRSKDLKNINQNNEYQRSNKVIEKSLSRERCRENDTKPLKVLSVKLVNEKNRSHRGRHQKNQKHSPKSKSRFNLNCEENVHQRTQNFQKDPILVADTPKSDVNMKQYQDYQKQANILSQSTENLYLLKLNQNENAFQKTDQFQDKKMRKNEKNSNKENQRHLINQIEQSYLNTMSQAELPPSLKLENQKMNSVTDIQRYHQQSQQFFENLPQQLNEIKNLLINIPENLQISQIHKDSNNIEIDKKQILEKNKLENFQYFGNFQSANLPQKKRNIMLNQSSENSIKQLKAKNFENKLSTQEEMPLREKNKDENNLEINQIIIQSLQNLEQYMKQIQKQDQNTKSVQSKDLQISREVTIEIPALVQNSVGYLNDSGNAIDNQMSNQDTLHSANKSPQNQLISIQNQQSFQKINEANQNNTFTQLNSKNVENLYQEDNINSQTNQNQVKEPQLQQNSSCKSTYTKDKLKNNLNQIDDQNCYSEQNNHNLAIHRSDEESFQQELENPNVSNGNKNQGYNETLKNSNFTKILCDNPLQPNQNLQDINDQNNEIEGLLNYVFQPQSNLVEELIEKGSIRQSFGGTNKKIEGSSYKKESNNRTVTLSEVVDCNEQNANYENEIQNGFNPFSSNNYGLQNNLSQVSQNYEAQQQKQQDYVILNQMQNSYKIVKLKTDPSLQSNLIAKKSFDDSQNNLVQSSSNQKSVNKQSFYEDNNQEINNYYQNQVNTQNLDKSQKNNQSIGSKQNQTQKYQMNSINEKQQLEDSQSSSQQRHLLQLDGNHNYHRAETKQVDSSIQLFNQNHLNRQIKDDNLRYNHENQSEQINSRKSNSQSRRSLSRKSKRQSDFGTLQSDIQNNQINLQLDKNKINNNLIQQIQNLQTNMELPNRLDPERKQFYREHFQANNTISQNSSGEKHELQSHIQTKTQTKFQNEKPYNRKKSPKTDLLRGYKKRIVQQDESKNGLFELDRSSIQPKSLYDSTVVEHHNIQKEPPKFQIEKRQIDQNQNDNQAVRVSASTSQPFKKKMKNYQNSQEQEVDIKKQEYSPQNPPQYSFNKLQNLPDQKTKHVSECQKKLTTPKRSPEMNNHRIEWQDTLMKVPQNNDFSQPIQKINGNPWSNSMYITHSFLPQQYSQPVFFAPIQNPYPQIQQPFFFGYEKKNQNIQNHNIPTLITSHSKNSKSQEKSGKIIQIEDMQKRQNQLYSSYNNKPFRTVLNMQSQKLQQSYSILQNEFEKKKEEEKYQNYSQAQRKLNFQDNERFLNENQNNQDIQYEQNKVASHHSLDQSQSLNLSDGLDIQEVVPVQRNYKRTIQNEQLQLPFGQSQTISSQYKRETINNSQSNQNQLSNSSLMHNTNNPGFQKDLFVERAYSRNVNDSNQQFLNQIDENQLSGQKSHQTSQSFIKSVSLKGHILAAKSPKFCNSITFDNQANQISSQIDSQHIQIPNSSLQFSPNKEDNQNSSSKQSYAQNKSNISQIQNQQQISLIEYHRNYQYQNRILKEQNELQSPQPSIMISHLQSLQINNQSSVNSPNSDSQTPITQLNNMNSIINKEQNYQLHSHKDTMKFDMNNQESREYDKSISKKQKSHLTMQQEQTPEGFQSQYAGDSKSATVDQRDHQNIQQNNSILIKRLSSFKSDYSDIIHSNQQILNISRESQTIKNQQKVMNSAQRFNSQRETDLKTGNIKDYDKNIFQRVKNQVRGSSFDPQNMKNISKDFKKECENYLDPELTPITNNLSNQNFFKQNMLNSDNNLENEILQKSLVSDDCRDMILEFKRNKNNNVILNMEKNMKQLQERIQSKIELQGSKNSQSTYNLPPRSQTNKIQLQNDSQNNFSENILRPSENLLHSKAQDNYKFQINERIFQQTSQTTLNSCHKNSQLDYQFHQKQLSKYSDPNAQKLNQQRSSQILASNQSSQKDIGIFKKSQLQENEQIQSIEDFKQNSEKSFQKLSDLQSSNSLKQIQNGSLDQPLFSKRYLPKDFKSIYSGKEDQNEMYGYYKSSSNLQNSESYNDEAENQISRSLIEVQVKEFLQQPNIVKKLKIAGNLDEVQDCNQKLRNMKINIDSASNSCPVYSQSGYEQAAGGFLMQTGEDFEESFRDSKSQSRISMGKLLESNKTIIKEMREQNSKESSRQFLRSEHFQ